MILSLIQLLATDIVGIIINVANANQDIFKLVSMKEGGFYLLILIKCFMSFQTLINHLNVYVELLFPVQHH